jgi:protoporphyrin/coproporphyrin ferrochelatase
MPGIRGEPTDAPAELPEAEEMPHVTNGPTVAPAPSEAIAAPEPEPPAGEAESDILELPSATPAPASPIELPALSIEPPRVAEARSEARVPHEEPAMPAPPGFAPQTPPDQQAVEAETPGEAMPATSGIGVLLVNLGTPDAAEPKAVRRYLKEFLADRRVIETDGLLWKMVLNGIILPLRSRRRARDYQKIWNKEKDESPLKTITRSQAEKLAGILEPLGKDIVVDWAMRYASPSIASRLQAMVARGCDRILLMPLYPQYAAATTATACDEVFRFMMGLRRQPALRVLPAYYDDPYYIEVLASSLKAEIKALPFEPDVILASYHGLPREYVAKGDPYEAQCAKTTQLLREQLKLDDSKLMMTFQSRFGRAKWLEPYTISTVKALARKGVKNLVVVTPGFAADCLETLEEIAVENARVFKRYGGENFAAIPCLNDSEAGMLMIWQLAMRELKGWV